jgi:hypothetical protein
MHTVVAYQQCIRSPHYSAQIFLHTVYMCTNVHLLPQAEQLPLNTPGRHERPAHLCCASTAPQSWKNQKAKKKQKKPNYGTWNWNSVGTLVIF